MTSDANNLTTERQGMRGLQRWLDGNRHEVVKRGTVCSPPSLAEEMQLSRGQFNTPSRIS